MAWTHEQLSAVWNKGHIINGNDKNIFRQDECGAWIAWKEHGNRNSQYGWEVDHITPIERGGSDDISNLRPLQWRNNASKQDGRLSCVVRSSGTTNTGL